MAEQGVALLYARVSTQLQVNDGVSLDVQERQLRQAAELAGYTEFELVREEGRSGKSITGRPALRPALKRLHTETPSALFVTRIDRLARSTKDFLGIIDRANANKWRLVMLDLNLDTASYQGRFVVTIMSALAEMERGIIAERQKDVHKDRRARGIKWGVDMGPKNKTSNSVKDLIKKQKDSGVSFHEIARRLNNNGVPTQNGGKWYATTVNNIYDSLD
jgi:DNA invertase Pin-like site-specific DNA recombinase